MSGDKYDKHRPCEQTFLTLFSSLCGIFDFVLFFIFCVVSSLLSQLPWLLVRAQTRRFLRCLPNRYVPIPLLKVDVAADRSFKVVII